MHTRRVSKSGYGGNYSPRPMSMHPCPRWSYGFGFHISRQKIRSLAVVKLYLTSIIHPQPRPVHSINIPANKNIEPLSQFDAAWASTATISTQPGSQHRCPAAAKAHQDRRAGASKPEVCSLTALFVSLAGKIWTAGSELLHHFLFPSLYQFSTCEAQHSTTKCSCNSRHFEARKEANRTPHHSSDERTCHRQSCQLVFCSL